MGVVCAAAFIKLRSLNFFFLSIFRVPGDVARLVSGVLIHNVGRHNNPRFICAFSDMERRYAPGNRFPP